MEKKWHKRRHALSANTLCNITSTYSSRDVMSPREQQRALLLLLPGSVLPQIFESTCNCHMGRKIFESKWCGRVPGRHRRRRPTGHYTKTDNYKIIKPESNTGKTHSYARQHPTQNRERAHEKNRPFFRSLDYTRCIGPCELNKS